MCFWPRGASLAGPPGGGPRLGVGAGLHGAAGGGPGAHGPARRPPGAAAPGGAPAAAVGDAHRPGDAHRHGRARQRRAAGEATNPLDTTTPEHATPGPWIPPPSQSVHACGLVDRVQSGIVTRGRAGALIGAWWARGRCPAREQDHGLARECLRYVEVVAAACQPGGHPAAVAACGDGSAPQFLRDALQLAVTVVKLTSELQLQV